MATKTVAIETVKQFLAQCKQQLPFHIDRAILFGSTATDTATHLSDIDLALFSSSFTDNILANIDLYGKVNIHFPDIDVHAYPTEQYQRDSMMMDQIRSTGIEIRA